MYMAVTKPLNSLKTRWYIVYEIIFSAILKFGQDYLVE